MTKEIQDADIEAIEGRELTTTAYPTAHVLPDGWKRGHRSDWYDGPSVSAYLDDGQFVIACDAPFDPFSRPVPTPSIPVAVARAVLGTPAEAEQLRAATKAIGAALDKVYDLEMTPGDFVDVVAKALEVKP